MVSFAMSIAMGTIASLAICLQKRVPKRRQDTLSCFFESKKNASDCDAMKFQEKRCFCDESLCGRICDQKSPAIAVAMAW